MGYCLFSITLSCTASRLFTNSSYSTTTLTLLQHFLKSCFTPEFTARHCFSLTSSLLFTELLASVTHFPSHPFLSTYYYCTPVGIPGTRSPSLTCVALPEELHTHHSKDEDNDTEDKGEVAQRPDGLAHDGDEEVEGGPGLGQLEYSQLRTLFVNV